ncbi:MAG: crossover junction endodeoxyribonuclease RuvC, partial [Rickettsiales bacterium]|nr:crossover junction endodeoxyribonuclease RuvC [Rickettsiales bacterium]
WGIVGQDGGRLSHIANGTIRIKSSLPFSERLEGIFSGLAAILREYRPEAASVEETFVNVNPQTTLKLGCARGAAILAPAVAGIPVFEYSPATIKQAVTGVGRAAKEQVAMMVGAILGRPGVDSEHAADALAMAICHAHNRLALAPKK